MRFAVRWRIELKHGRMVGNAPGLWLTFRSSPTKGQMSSRGQYGLEMPLGLRIWPCVMHLLGQRSFSNQPGSARGQIAQENPITTKFGRMNPWLESSTMMGSKVIQGSTGVSQGRDCSGMPYGHQESLTKVWCIDEIKGHVGVSQGQPEVKLLRNTLRPPKEGGRTLDQGVIALLGSKVIQRSAEVNQGSNCFGMLYGHQFFMNNPWTEF